MPLFRILPEPIRHLTGRHWSWIHFKAVMLVWIITLLVFTPTKVDTALGAVLILVGAVTIIGALVSMVGIVISAQPGKTGTFGIGIEFSGIVVMALGPLAYFVIQVYLAVTLPDGDQRYALCVLAWLVCAALICRLVVVAPRWWNTRPRRKAR